MAAVAGVEHDHLERRQLLAALPHGWLSRSGDVEHEARGVGQGGGTDRPGRSLEDHAEEAVRPRPLQTDLGEEPVADVVGLRAAREADQSDARFLGSARFDAMGDGRRRFDDDTRERRIRPDPQIRQGDLRRRGDEPHGGRGGRRPGHERGKNATDERPRHQPDPVLDPHRRVQHDGLPVDEHLRPVPRESDDVVARAQTGPRAHGGRVDPGLQGGGHLGELDVRAAVVSDHGQDGARATRPGEQERDHSAGQASDAHRMPILTTETSRRAL